MKGDPHATDAVLRGKADPAAEPILDTRREEDFLSGHAVGAVNIPLEALAWRVYELPPKGAALRVFDSSSRRMTEAAAWLASRGYKTCTAGIFGNDLTRTGSSPAVLWRPSAFLVEALEIIGRMAPKLPKTALDIACGSGREAVHLAMLGWEVDAVDVLPDALERAAGLAKRCGVKLNLIRRNLKREAELPVGKYGLVCVFRFLHRPLLPELAAALVPGGYLVYETFYRGPAPEETAGPRRGENILRDGELAAAFGGMNILISRDCIRRKDGCFSQLLARKGIKANS